MAKRKDQDSPEQDTEYGYFFNTRPDAEAPIKVRSSWRIFIQSESGGILSRTWKQWLKPTPLRRNGIA